MRSYSVLIAEDDAPLLDLLKETFDNKNFVTLIAKDGKTALDLYLKHKPEIILMDIDMPEMNGWEVLSEIRKNDELIPIIIMTGRSVEEDDSVTSYDQGATFFLRKPFGYREILGLIGNLAKTTYGQVNVISFAGFKLNMNSFTLEREGQSQPLTEREAKVLYMLCKNLNYKVSTTDILNEVWYGENPNNYQMLKNTMLKLRKIIDADPELQLKSIYGEGYILQIK